MKKRFILRAVNLVLALSFLWVAGTAVLHDQLIEVFHKLHPAGGFIMIAMVIAHLILNWGWIKNNYLPFLKKKRPS
ncbi:hypothetical protein ACFL4W_02505 [Planctomycetota bacterium]